MAVKPHSKKFFVISKKSENSDLAAFPESVNILPLVENDPRSSENLIDGVNDTAKYCEMFYFVNFSLGF